MSCRDDIDNLLQQAEQAEDQKHYDLVNRIEAHMWLDGPRSEDGRVPGSARDLFLRMNIIPLKSPSPGKDEAAEGFVQAPEGDRRAHAAHLGRPRFPAPAGTLRAARQAHQGRAGPR